MTALGRRQSLRVLQVQRQQDDEGSEHSGKQGMENEQPGLQAALAHAVEVVAGEDGERRNGRQDVAGKLGLGEGEEDDGNERPQDEKLREGVARAEVSHVVVFRAARPPFGNGLAHGINERRDGHHRPGREREDHDGDVVPEALFVLEAVGGEALQVVLEEEDPEEVRVAVLYRDEPGQHHRQVENDSRPPDGSAQDGPLSSQRGKGDRG